jgi:tight adherence protein C
LVVSGWSLSAEEFLGGKIALSAVAFGVGLVFASLPLAVALALACFVGPDLVLARAARARVTRIDHAVPQFLDLLAAGSSAGLAAPMALERAVQGLRGPLADVLSASLSNVALGSRWRDELRALAEALDLADLRRAVSAVTRSERLGVPLSVAMTELAADVRRTRRDAAAERARKAPVKMLFPLVFCIFPSIFVVIIGPAIIQIQRTL